MDSLAITFITATLLTLFYAERMMGIFYEKRRTNRLVMLLTYGLLLALQLFQYAYYSRNPAPMLIMMASDMLIYLLGFFVISLNYRSSVLKRLAAVVSTYMVLALATIPVGTVVGYILYVRGMAISEELSIILLYLLLPLFMCLTATLLRGFTNIKRKSAVVSPAIVIVPVLVVLVIFVYYFLLLLVFPAVRGDILYVIQLIGAVLMPLGFIFLIFYLHDAISTKYEGKLKAVQHAQEKEYYFTQCQLMQASAKQVRAMQHDMKIHLAALKDFTDSCDWDDVKKYLGRLVEDVEKSEVYSDTGNIAFDSVINYKLRNAKSGGITLDLSVAVPPALGVDVVDVVTILGNLLDNALDAVAKVSEKMIKLDIALVKGGLFVKVDNFFDGDVKYLAGQMVSQKDGEGHGYGLKNVKRSVEKYDGQVHVSHEDGVFSVGVFLYVGDMPPTCNQS